MATEMNGRSITALQSAGFAVTQESPIFNTWALSYKRETSELRVQYDAGTLRIIGAHGDALLVGTALSRCIAIVGGP